MRDDGANGEGKSWSMSLALPVCVCLLAGWLGVQAGRPFITARKMRAENARLYQANQAMRMENQELRRTAAALETPEGKEREARGLGYVREGEVHLMIPPK